MKPLILTIALLLLHPSYLADIRPPEWERTPTSPADILIANRNVYKQWEPGGKVILYPGGIKRKEYEK